MLSGMRRLAVAPVFAVACAAIAVAVTPAHAATSMPRTVEALAQTTMVSAHGQKVAWSRYDPASANYRLVVTSIGDLDAAPTVLPIAPRAAAFDVDLGPGPAGQTVAVYSRCATEPDGDYYGQKLWPNNASGCDIYAYDFKAGAERRLTNLSSPVGEEFLPTIWKGQVAFARSYGRYREGEWRDAMLYTHSVSGTEPSRRQSQGSVRGLQRISLTGLDLYGRRLALTRRFIGYDAGTSQARLTTLGSGSRLLLQRNSGLTQRILRSPQIHHGRVLWSEQCAADTGGCTAANYRFWRSPITTNAFTFSAAPRWTASAAFILDSVWWVRAAPGFGFDNVSACQGSDPPDPAARCLLTRAFVTFSR